MKRTTILLTASLLAASCTKHDPSLPVEELPKIPLSEVAELLSSLPIESEQMREVHDAVSNSSGNGYDEEYTLGMLFESPGSGVGENFLPAGTKAAPAEYGTPLRDLIKDRLSSRFLTKAGLSDDDKVERYIDALSSSDIQIYWPYSDSWNGSDRPVVTFNPGGTGETNIGYRLGGDGSVEEVVVDEEYAMNNPVWVVNNNEDAAFLTPEILRRQGIDLEQGGSIGIGSSSGTKSLVNPSNKESRTLCLQKFLTTRNYDPWFTGASEFWIKVGALNNFKAATEAEMRLYYPSINDLMIVVKRSQVGEWIPLNCVLMSDLTEQVETVAFMAVEDDGGTLQNWNCEALVKVNSKSYGVTISIPVNSRDDIVWRGTLSYSYLLKMNNLASRFGDVKMAFYLK